jgi:hypothetical protein
LIESPNNQHQDKVGGCLFFFVKLAFAVGIYLVIGGALAWAPPHTVILLTSAAMAWYFIRQGAGQRFNLRTILVFMTGIAVIIAAAALMPVAMHSDWSRIANQQIVVKLIDQTTKTSIKDAKVELTSQVAKQLMSQKGSTSSKGTVKFTVQCAQTVRKSLLQAQTTCKTDGWTLKAEASTYKPASKTLSDIVVDGEGGGPINLRIELEPIEE